MDIVGRGWSFPPRLGDRNRISTVTDHTNVRQAIYVIINTIPGERVMRPDFGCEIHSLVFAPANEQTAATAERFVREALNRWEPRIVLENVIVTPGGSELGELLIEIVYRLKANYDPNSLVVPYYLAPEAE